MSKNIKKLFLLVFLLLVNLLAWSEAPIFTSAKNEAGGFTIFVENKNIYPITIKLKPEVENMIADFDEEHLFVVPAKKENYKLTTFTIERPGKKYSYKYKYWYITGDATSLPNTSFVYQLPFTKGQSFKVYQGYNGNFSHQGKRELDFTMPVGTPINAARGGLVIEIVQTNNQSCPQQECSKYNNYIKILHDDGTIASYLHIKQNSSRVQVGQQITINTPIAESGNVGWTSGPHLHFSVSKPAFNESGTIDTKFSILASPAPQLLKEAESYSW